MTDNIMRDHVLGLPPNTPHPRVCIFAAFNEKYAPLADIARSNWILYAKAHGYSIRWYPQGFHLDSSRPETYGDKGRFQWYFDLKGHCEIVVYVDIDTLFLNMNIKIERIIGQDNVYPEPPPFHWLYDDNGPLSGFWIARTDDITEKHLRHAYEYAAVNNNVRHGKIEPNGISDQDAMTRLMNIPPFSRTFGHCYPAVPLLCYPENHVPEAFMITFPGICVEEKMKLMKEWSNRV